MERDYYYKYVAVTPPITTGVHCIQAPEVEIMAEPLGKAWVLRFGCHADIYLSVSQMRKVVEVLTTVLAKVAEEKE